MQLKRLLLVLVMLLASRFAHAALTKAQVNQVRAAIAQMEQTLVKMQRLSMATLIALNNGNSFTIEFSTVPVNLTAQQQQDIVNYYNLLKTQLEAQVNTLP